jgi:hypothetical protein
MQFLLLIYGDEVAELALTPEERRAIVDQHRAFGRRLRERGRFLGGDGLTPSRDAVVVRGSRVTDGPFIETKEQLGGYYLVDCEDREAAIGLAKEIPASPGYAVEIRPIGT